MPRLDGIQATNAIAGSNSTARVLILTTFDLDQYVVARLRAGASGVGPQLMIGLPTDQPGTG